MEGTQLVTAVANALPFCAAERQALMEAPSLQDLEDLLLTLMEGVGERFRNEDPLPVAH
jgi:Lon protease-like protein